VDRCGTVFVVHPAIAVLAVIVALGAAARSTWSPCGLSMLSTITPVTERARGHRYGVTAAWFVVGGIAGGATLGLVTAGLAAGVSAAGWSETTVLAVAAGLAVLAALADSGALGKAAKPPIFKRQVDDAWLSTYRSWVYGLGFGWQIGAGVTTYIMTTAVFLTIGLAALTAGPLLAFALAVLFGLARGLAVLLSARLRSPAAMLALHARLEALESPVQLAVIGIEVAVAAIAAGLAWGPLAAVLALAVSAGPALVATRRATRPARIGPIPVDAPTTRTGSVSVSA